MPDIPLLTPVVLRGVVEKLVVPETLHLLSSVPQTPWPYPAVNWDIIRGSRAVAKPNVPNSEAHVVPRLGRSAASASFVYLREKKVFEPTTLHWLRAPGELAARNAEAAVMREIADLNQRFDNFAEFLLWQSVKGSISMSFTDVQIAVDYQFAATHKIAAPATSWLTATPDQIVADVQSWKRLIWRDGRVAANQAYLSERTLTAITQAFARSGDVAGGFLSDRMRDQYYATGKLPGFMGVDWETVESVYQDDAGVVTQFIPDGAISFGNFTDQRPIELYIGPTADDEAPEQFTGKFAKTWKDKDPSARQYLLEWNLLPVITRAEQFVYISNVL